MERTHKIALISILVGIVTCTLWFFLMGHIGFDLADEGFYWYGAQRVVHGGVPLRDFQAYDLGRYFYTAQFLFAAHDTGLMVARIAAYSLLFPLVAIVVFITLGSVQENDRNSLRSWFLALSVAFLALL